MVCSLYSNAMLVYLLLNLSLSYLIVYTTYYALVTLVTQRVFATCYSFILIVFIGTRM